MPARKLLLLLPLLLGLLGCKGGADCELAGRWQGFVQYGRWSGESIVQHFNPEGVYRLEVESALFVGTWSVVGDVVSISDGSCVTEGAGTFELRWADCGTFVYHTVDDPCTSRGDSINGTTMTQPYM